MPARPFGAQHRNGAGDHGRKAEQDMDANNRQEERIGGRYRDAQNDWWHGWDGLLSSGKEAISL